MHDDTGHVRFTRFSGQLAGPREAGSVTSAICDLLATLTPTRRHENASLVALPRFQPTRWA